MTYTIIVPKRVQKQLDALPDDVYDRVAIKIRQLAQDPRPDGVVKMKGSDRSFGEVYCKPGYLFAWATISFVMRLTTMNN